MEDNFEKELERVAETSAPEINFESLDLPSDMAEQIRQIESLAQIDSEFANSQEYKDLMASISNSGQASKSDSEEEDEDEEYDEEEEENEEETVDSDDIFGILKSSKKEKEVRLSFEPPKEMVKMLSSKYGIEDASKFFASVDTWRNQAQEGSDVKREYEALTEDLQSLPADIRTQIQLWANGEDHTQFMNVQQRLDFSSDFDEQEVDGLVQHYLPEQYNKLTRSLENGDIDEADFDDRITLLAESTKRMFIEDKKALEADREQFIERQKNQFQNLKKTALLSVENLSKAYPNFSKSEINKIRSVLVEGKIDSLFTKSDGTYNEDAAELVAYAMYGKKMLESVKKISERKGESKANQKMVDSSPKTVKKQKAAGGNQGLGMEAVGHLSGVFKGDPYASR
jgi:hypothetical protein